MGHFCDSFCTMIGIYNSTMSTHGCPHCSFDLLPEDSPLPHHLGQFHSQVSRHPKGADSLPGALNFKK